MNTVVTYGPSTEARALLEELLGSSTRLNFLGEVPEEDRVSELSAATVLLSWHPSRELREEEWPAIGGAELMQLVSAGADHIPFERLPPEMTLASNAGAFAEPMAEHVLAMTLALSKRLVIEHERLSAGEFNQGTQNRTVRGKVCGILGFGGIGRATSRLMRAVGMEIYTLNRSGHTGGEPVDFIGISDDLEYVLSTSDVVVVTLPLTRATEGFLGARELGWMKPDAILINVARGEVIDEAALYERLNSHPEFMAGLDAWWVEPFRHGEFRTDHSFLELPNVLGSPHNSAMVPGAFYEGQRLAAENVLLYLKDGSVAGKVGPDDQ